MPDPLLLPSIALLAGGAWTMRDYLRRRFSSAEDRYMALYGREEWAASNMDLVLHCAQDADQRLKRAFLERLEARLVGGDPSVELLREEADLEQKAITFHAKEGVDVQALMKPRAGVYFDLDSVGKVRVVWNHMQTDGVGMWNSLRLLFDENPPLVSFRKIKEPPPVLPELIALPSVARRLVWRGRLRKGLPDEQALTRGFERWDARSVKAAKKVTGGAFNLVSSAMVIDRVFARHPERAKLNVGLTVYFPFIEGRNKYGVFLCRVKRGPLASIVSQLIRQTKNPLKGWGMSSAQSYALGRMPDAAFQRLISYYRKQVDVLVSNLPVGRRPVTLDGIPTAISCHPWELTLPYYFLLIGTLRELHVSFTSRYEQEPDFLALDDEYASVQPGSSGTPGV